MRAADSTLTRVAAVLQDVRRGGLAGLIAGAVVSGIGGRIMMTIAAVVNPQATGAFTSNGQVIGRFSISGTIELLFFGGLGAGMVASVLWVIVSPWLPRRGPRRWLLAMPVTAALGAGFLIESTNADFQILHHDGVIIAAIVLLMGLAGAAIAWLDDWMARRQAAPSARVDQPLVISIVFAGLGILPLSFALLAYLSPTFADSPRPLGVGYALLVVGLATAALWINRIRTGHGESPPMLRLVGTAALLAAVALGVMHAGGETAAILAL
jgi:hypothetical protein